LLFAFRFYTFKHKSIIMKYALLKSLMVFSVCIGWIFFSSWTDGPAPESAQDSLAIIRVVKPMNELFNIKPVVFVSKGLGRIDEVKVSDAEYGNGDFMLKRTLTDFLANGYTIQTATETAESGMQLNTYYLKKKVI
jgi:hypothetical protein